MNNFISYEERIRDFDWRLTEQELGYKAGSVINIGWYCTDRICLAGKADKIALIYETIDGVVKKYSYEDLRKASNTVGAFLVSLGIKNGDRVCILMDRIPELYFSFIGILKIGAIAQPLFSVFGDESLLVRLRDAQTRVIITQRKHISKIRKILKKLTNLDFIIIVDNPDDKTLEDKEVAFCLTHTELVDQMDICPTYAESPSVLHYTSGTTGNPKGVLHIHYSLISQYITAKWVLDLKENDIYWCTADPGWVTGTSYGIIGPWSLGVTNCVLEAGFTPRNWYRFIENNKITVWYSAPTAVRSLMKAGDELLSGYDVSSLRHLASVGEPLNSVAVTWSQKKFGKPFLDTFWQTETGSIMISNFPGMKIKPGSMGKPFPGITATILDPETFQPFLKSGKIGLIAFKPGWPSMMRGYLNNEKEYNKKFVNGWYLTGERARIDKEG